MQQPLNVIFILKIIYTILYNHDDESHKMQMSYYVVCYLRIIHIIYMKQELSQSTWLAINWHISRNTFDETIMISKTEDAKAAAKMNN